MATVTGHAPAARRAGALIASAPAEYETRRSRSRGGTESAEELDRDRIQRAARHVDRVPRQDIVRIAHGEGVRELHRESPPASGGRRAERRNQVQRRGEPEVVLEDVVGDLETLEAESVAKDLHDARLPEERWVELDHRVEPAVLEQVAGDLLDLFRRAAVHGRQRDAVGDVVRKLDVCVDAGTRSAVSVAPDRGTLGRSPAGRGTSRQRRCGRPRACIPRSG